MQIADLHFSVGAGPCRDPSSPCDGGAYAYTDALVERALDEERPDLVVFTGDQLNGQGTSWDPTSVLAKFAAPVISRRIPWAAVFGNHDDEDGGESGSRRNQLRQMQGLPYSLVQPGPEDIHGVGNYVLKVASADASKTHLLTLYFLDSGAYAAGLFTWFGFFPTEYDYIHQDQMDWFLQESGMVYAYGRGATILTCLTLSLDQPYCATVHARRRQGLWQYLGTSATPTSGAETRKTECAYVFPHPSVRLDIKKPQRFIQLTHRRSQETYSTPDTDPRTGQPLDIGTSDLESPSSAKKNAGFFEKGLLHALETPHRGAGGIPEVKVVGNGHCHGMAVFLFRKPRSDKGLSVTDNCKRVDGVWFCFGGGG